MSFEDAIARYMADMPEAKLELIDGQLIVGNGLVGSRRLLGPGVLGTVLVNDCCTPV